jgi:hypothetical protein
MFLFGKKKTASGNELNLDPSLFQDPDPDLPVVLEDDGLDDPDLLVS